MENSRIGKFRWTICSLLFFATTVNYLDRQVLSLLHPILEDQFGWTNSDYANITAAFQFVYALSMLFAGRFIDRLGTKKGLTIAIIIWSLGAVAHAYAVQMGEFCVELFGIQAVSASVLGFILARTILGVGEAGNFPAAIKATAEYFPKNERALATGIFNSGSNIGAILAPLTVPWMAKNWGWQSAFIIVGIIGFVWLIFWIIIYEIPERQKRLSKPELDYILSDSLLEENKSAENPQPKVAWFTLLKFKQTWSFTIGKFLTDGVWWFFLFWLPSFLKTQYNMQSTEMVLPLTVLYSMTMVGSISGGAFPMYFINKGYSAYDGRMRAMFIIALFPLVILAAQPLGHYSFWIPVVLIGIGASAHQAWSANIFSTVSDMFPKAATATVTGIGGMAGGLGGVIISKLGGRLFDHYQALGEKETGYMIMFSICAVMYLLAWVIMKTLVPKMKVIHLDK